MQTTSWDLIILECNYQDTRGELLRNQWVKYKLMGTEIADGEENLEIETPSKRVVRCRARCFRKSDNWQSGRIGIVINSTKIMQRSKALLPRSHVPLVLMPLSVFGAAAERCRSSCHPVDRLLTIALSRLDGLLTLAFSENHAYNATCVSSPQSSLVVGPSGSGQFVVNVASDLLV
jgi:hypothetical protein